MSAVLAFSDGALAQSPDRTAAEDDVFWESVSGCTDAVEVELYIEEFGEEGRHVTAARACLEKLRKAVSDTVGKRIPSTEVERLLEVCEMHFAANRLTTGRGRDSGSTAIGRFSPWTRRTGRLWGVAACIREVCGLGTCCIGEGERG